MSVPPIFIAKGDATAIAVPTFDNPALDDVKSSLVNAGVAVDKADSFVKNVNDPVMFKTKFELLPADEKAKMVTEINGLEVAQPGYDPSKALNNLKLSVEAGRDQELGNLGSGFRINVLYGGAVVGGLAAVVGADDIGRVAAKLTGSRALGLGGVVLGVLGLTAAGAGIGWLAGNVLSKPLFESHRAEINNRYDGAISQITR